MDNLWTTADFDRMGWHDTHVHALRLIEGPYGAGQLQLDLDYILQWNCDHPTDRFLLLPATLTFFDTAQLRLSLDYASACAALGPFSLNGLHRTLEERERYCAQLWTLELNWPQGQITLEASGFEQRGWGRPVWCFEQVLPPQQRLPAGHD